MELIGCLLVLVVFGVLFWKRPPTRIFTLIGGASVALFVALSSWSSSGTARLDHNTLMSRGLVTMALESVIPNTRFDSGTISLVVALSSGVLCGGAVALLLLIVLTLAAAIRRRRIETRMNKQAEDSVA